MKEQLVDEKARKAQRLARMAGRRRGLVNKMLIKGAKSDRSGPSSPTASTSQASSSRLFIDTGGISSGESTAAGTPTTLSPIIERRMSEASLPDNASGASSTRRRSGSKSANSGGSWQPASILSKSLPTTTLTANDAEVYRSKKESGNGNRQARIASLLGRNAAGMRTPSDSDVSSVRSSARSHMRPESVKSTKSDRSLSPNSTPASTSADIKGKVWRNSLSPAPSLSPVRNEMVTVKGIQVESRRIEEALADLLKLQGFKVDRNKGVVVGGKDPDGAPINSGILQVARIQAQNMAHAEAEFALNVNFPRVSASRKPVVVHQPNRPRSSAPQSLSKSGAAYPKGEASVLSRDHQAAAMPQILARLKAKGWATSKGPDGKPRKDASGDAIYVDSEGKEVHPSTVKKEKAEGVLDMLRKKKDEEEAKLLTTVIRVNAAKKEAKKLEELEAKKATAKAARTTGEARKPDGQSPKKADGGGDTASVVDPQLGAQPTSSKNKKKRNKKGGAGKEGTAGKEDPAPEMPTMASGPAKSQGLPTTYAPTSSASPATLPSTVTPSVPPVALDKAEKKSTKGPRSEQQAAQPQTPAPERTDTTTANPSPKKTKSTADKAPEGPGGSVGKAARKEAKETNVASTQPTPAPAVTPKEETPVKQPPPKETTKEVPKGKKQGKKVPKVETAVNNGPAEGGRGTTGATTEKKKGKRDSVEHKQEAVVQPEASGASQPILNSSEGDSSKGPATEPAKEPPAPPPVDKATAKKGKKEREKRGSTDGGSVPAPVQEPEPKKENGHPGRSDQTPVNPSPGARSAKSDQVPVKPHKPPPPVAQKPTPTASNTPQTRQRKNDNVEEQRPTATPEAPPPAKTGRNDRRPTSQPTATPAPNTKDGSAATSTPTPRNRTNNGSENSGGRSTGPTRTPATEPPIKAPNTSTPRHRPSAPLDDTASSNSQPNTPASAPKTTTPSYNAPPAAPRVFDKRDYPGLPWPGPKPAVPNLGGAKPQKKAPQVPAADQPTSSTAAEPPTETPKAPLSAPTPSSGALETSSRNTPAPDVGGETTAPTTKPRPIVKLPPNKKVDPSPENKKVDSSPQVPASETPATPAQPLQPTDPPLQPAAPPQPQVKTRRRRRSLPDGVFIPPLSSMVPPQPAEREDMFPHETSPPGPAAQQPPQPAAMPQSSNTVPNHQARQSHQVGGANTIPPTGPRNHNGNMGHFNRPTFDHRLPVNRAPPAPYPNPQPMNAGGFNYAPAGMMPTSAGITMTGPAPIWYHSSQIPNNGQFQTMPMQSVQQPIQSIQRPLGGFQGSQFMGYNNGFPPVQQNHNGYNQNVTGTNPQWMGNTMPNNTMPNSYTMPPKPQYMPQNKPPRKAHYSHRPPNHRNNANVDTPRHKPAPKSSAAPPPSIPSVPATPSAESATAAEPAVPAPQPMMESNDMGMHDDMVTGEGVDPRYQKHVNQGLLDDAYGRRRRAVSFS